MSLYSPSTLCTRVCVVRDRAVSDRTSERIEYKRGSADLAIEVMEDNVGFLSMEVGKKHTGHLLRHRLRVRDICALCILSSNCNRPNGYC